jgi:quinol monooxygenase YgiN
MTDEQRNRLQALLPAMRVNARRARTQNEYHRRFNVIEALEDFMRAHAHGETSVYSYQMLENPKPTTIDMAEEWISIAEKAAEGHDKPGIVRMPSMAAVLSGMPPEHKEEAWERS